MSFGNDREARLLHLRDAEHRQDADEDVRDRDPLAAALAVFLAEREPAAVTLAEVLGDVGEVDELVREQVRGRVQRPDDVRPLPGIRGDGGLRQDVVLPLAFDPDLDPGRLRERLDVRPRRRILGIEELAPAQEPKARVRLGLEGLLLGPGRGPFEPAGRRRRAGGERAGLEDVAAGREMAFHGHGVSSVVPATR